MGKQQHVENNCLLYKKLILESAKVHINILEFTYMNNVRSIERVLDLFEHFARSLDPLTLTAVAAHFDLPKSSALAILRTLVDRGYVVKNDQGHYALEDTFRRHGFGWGGDHFSRAVAFAKPLLQVICDETGESVMVGAMVGDDSVRLLAQAVSPQIVRYESSIDAITPAYCTAMGRVLLAFGDEKRQARALSKPSYPVYTTKTVTNPKSIRASIVEARKDGVAIVDSEYVDGGVGIAVPVFGDNGTPLLALNVGCVSSRFQEKKDQILESLKKAVQYINLNFPNA
ncbi:IclR family transcriptional regulator [Glaciimonas soli]|nr:IclR family transcriptional regulator [Glaciimonas soli]